MTVMIFLIFVLCYSLRVRLVGSAEVNALTPFSELGLRGCAYSALSDSSIQCSGYTYINSSNSLATLISDWRILLNTVNDVVFVSLDFTFAQVISAIASDFSSRIFIQVDSAINPPLPNTIGISFSEDQSGYLAGAVASIFTSTMKVGVIAAFPIPPVKRYRNGFLNGVYSACPNCEVHSVFVNSWTDREKGRTAAQMLLNKSVDVVFNVGGLMGTHGIIYASSVNAFVIGVDTDQSRDALFQNTSNLNYLLTSVTKNVEVAVNSTLLAIAQGTNGGYNVVLGSALGGIGLASMNSTNLHNLTDSVSVTIQGSRDSCPSSLFQSRQSVIDYIKTNLETQVTATGVVYTSGGFAALDPQNSNVWNHFYAFGDYQAVPSGTQGHTAFYIGSSKILVWGGQAPAASMSANVKILDYNLGTYSTILSSSIKPSPRMFHAACVRQDTMFIFGGYRGKTIFSDSWSYDIRTTQWSLLPTNGPVARSNAAFACTTNKMYIYGGISGSGTVLADFWSLDLTTFSWRLLSNQANSVPGPRYGALMIQVNQSSLILFGGIDSNVLGDLYIMDTRETTVWTKTNPEGRAPVAHKMSGVQLDSNRILFTGGMDQNGPINSSWVWKMAQNKWSTSEVPSLQTTLHSHQLVVFNQSSDVDACIYPESPLLLTCDVGMGMHVLSIGGSPGRPVGGIAAIYPTSEPPEPISGNISLSLIGIVTFLNCLGILITICLIMLMYKFRDRAIIKANNPRFSLFILAGSILNYVAIIILAWKHQTKDWIITGTFFLVIGFTLMFSALVVKTYQIYTIFSSVSQIRVKQWKYFFFIAVMVLIEVAIMSAWFLTDQLNEVQQWNNGVIWKIRVLDSRWVIGTAAPIVIMTIMGVILSFKTRNVHSQFNESQYIAITIYLFAVASMVSFPIFLLLDSPTVVFIICCILVTLTTFSVNGIFFGHKVLGLLFPQKDVFTKSSQNELQTLKCRHCNQSIKQRTRTP